MSSELGAIWLKPREVDLRLKGVSGSYFPLCGLISDWRDTGILVDRESEMFQANYVRNNDVRVGDLYLSLAEHLPISQAFRDAYCEGMSLDCIYTWLSAQMKEWATAYLRRVRALIAVEFRYSPVDITGLELALVSCVRVRLLIIALAVCTGVDPSELAVVSALPTLSNKAAENVYDDDSFMFNVENRVIHNLSIPSTGPNFIGSSFDVRTNAGVRKAYTDYNSRALFPDLIVEGWYPGEYTHVHEDTMYVSYFHIETPYGKTSVSHHRMCAINSPVEVDGMLVPMPSIMLTLIDYLRGRRAMSMDCIIAPSSVLKYMEDGNGYGYIINQLLSGSVPMHSIGFLQLQETAHRYRGIEFTGYKVTGPNLRKIDTLPKNYRDAYQTALNS